MKTPGLKSIAVLFVTSSLLLSGCSDKGETANAQDSESLPVSQAVPTELAWEDLMPFGEEALLAEMYTDYYDELENRMVADTQRLQDINPDNAEEFDINRIAEGSVDDTMEQIGTFNVVPELNGMSVRMPGYVVPLDFNAENKYKEFLLVPYFGACLHTPPPPPNQIVFVSADPAVSVPNIQEPFWVEGILTTGEFTTDLASTAYELRLTKIEKYDY